MKKLGKIRCDASKNAKVNAQRLLPRLARAYYKAGRQVLGSKKSPRILHRLRLETKRFRYTLEVFLPVYGPGLQSRIDSLRHIQDCLGWVNDRASTRVLLETALPHNSPHRRRLQERMDKQVEKLVRDFTRYWEDTFDAPGQQERWVAYLTRFAGGRPRG